MRLLQITDETKVDIKKVREYAEHNIVTLESLQAAIEDPLECIPVGDNPEHVVHIHDGYRVVYSIEQQPMGLLAHLSVSVEARNKYPNEAAVNLILKEFGMNEVLESVNVWLDENSQSVNILQKFKEKS